MRIRVGALSAVVFGLCLVAARADTIIIPDDYPTIQQGIDAAASGDLVIVRAGTYVENLAITGKFLTIESESGASATVIDGAGMGPVATAEFDSTIKGFTIRGGLAETGAAILGGENLTAKENIIMDNTADWGGAVSAYSGFIAANVISGNTGAGISDLISGAVSSNVIIGNTGSGISLWGGKKREERDPPAGGGNFYANRRAVQVLGNTICGNGGAGIAGAVDANALISGNTITNNQGRGIAFDYSNMEVTGNLIAENLGGGISATSLTGAVIAFNLITNNSAAKGAGIFSKEQDSNWPIVIAGNIIAGNAASEAGGAIYCAETYDGSLNPTVTSNTIVDNTAGLAGGGILCLAGINALVANTILWNNTAPEGNEIWVGDGGWPSDLSASYSDVKGGEAGGFVASGCGMDFGDGMIDADPLFVAAGDLHLTFLSPCGNAGTDLAPNLPAEDFEGDPRSVWQVVDIGADEFNWHLYVVGDAVPGQTVNVRVTSYPNMCTKLLLGAGVLDAPIPTLFGERWLADPLFWIYLERVPANGVIDRAMTVPAFWNPGETYPFQALCGGLEWPSTRLTNLHVVRVQEGPAP